MRASAPAAASVSSGSSSAATSGARGATIPDAAKRHGRGLPRVEILRVQLLDERHDDACAVAHQRLDDVRADGVLTEEPRQRALHRLAVAANQARGPSPADDPR